MHRLCILATPRLFPPYSYLPVVELALGKLLRTPICSFKQLAEVCPELKHVDVHI